MKSPSKKRRGRPPLPPEQRQTERVEMRCTKVQREKLDLLGGVQWLRDRIDRARVVSASMVISVDLTNEARTPKSKERTSP